MCASLDSNQAIAAQPILTATAHASANGRRRPIRVTADRLNRRPTSRPMMVHSTLRNTPEGANPVAAPVMVSAAAISIGPSNPALGRRSQRPASAPARATTATSISPAP
jgi:hypothetical protein